MTNFQRTISILLCAVALVVLTTGAQELKKDAPCKDQLVFPNADLDNYELPLVGKIRQVETQETSLPDNVKSDLIATTNFDELGRISNTFLTSSKIKVFGKEIYSYDPQNRLTLVVTYNPDGSSVIEDVFTYDSAGTLKQKITRNAKSKVIIWNKEFSYSDGYSEFFDRRHDYGFRFKKDNRCRIIELTSYKSDRAVTGKISITYDDEKNTMEESIYSSQGDLIDKKKAEFKFDEKGNWIEQTRYDAAIEDGKLIFKPLVIFRRKITYYSSK